MATGRQYLTNEVCGSGRCVPAPELLRNTAPLRPDAGRFDGCICIVLERKLEPVRYPIFDLLASVLAFQKIGDNAFLNLAGAFDVGFSIIVFGDVSQHRIDCRLVLQQIEKHIICLPLVGRIDGEMNAQCFNHMDAPPVFELAEHVLDIAARLVDMAMSFESDT